MNLTRQHAFEQRTAKSPTGCIEWIGPRHKNGYGIFTFKRKQQLAHRASYELHSGPFPAEACVLHRCDNPPCVNPAHLFLGDRGDNARDMASKGRQWLQKNPAGHPSRPIECAPRGSQHPAAKLTEAQVLEIRHRASRGERGKDLAAEFGCGKTLISQIIRGQIWTHVGGPIRTKQTLEQTND